MDDTILLPLRCLYLSGVRRTDTTQTPDSIAYRMVAGSMQRVHKQCMGLEAGQDGTVNEGWCDLMRVVRCGSAQMSPGGCMWNLQGKQKVLSKEMVSSMLEKTGVPRSVGLKDGGSPRP